ncbi:MAG: hypothetical protein JZD41_08750, partial [Thermoproteus sp.]|nr:hypothetical protein [Thermoproteus sp.]
VGKLVDYDGYVKRGRLWVRAKAIKEMTIELDGVKIRMADLAEAAAKAFSKEGGWSGNWLDFGPARKALELKADEEAPLKIPAFKAIAALIAQKADELRRKDLVEHVELRRYEIGEVEVKIMATKAREESVQIAQLEAIWREFKIGKYTHLRLVIGGEEYELLYSGGRFTITGEEAQKLKKALEELGLDVKLTSDGRIRFGYKRLEALLNKGVKAYAVRRAKMGEAMWRLEITYEGMTIVLEMSYNEHGNRLEKLSRTGKIEATIYEEGASEGKRVELDLDLLAAAGRNCKDCHERRLAKTFTIASEKGFKWSVTGRGKKHLYVYLPSDFRDVVHRFYSK